MSNPKQALAGKAVKQTCQSEITDKPNTDMKTKSIATVATLLGVAVTLNVNALAGPGPQPQFQTRKVSQQKKVIVTSSHERKAPATAKAVIKSEPTLHYVSGPKGLTFAFRK